MEAVGGRRSRRGEGYGSAPRDRGGGDEMCLKKSNKKRLGCELEGFIEIRLCKLRVIVRSHVLRAVNFLVRDKSRWLSLAGSNQGMQDGCTNTVDLCSLCARRLCI